MIYSPSFIRKMIYILVIAVLLLPLYVFSAPAGVDVSENPGGILERQRREHKLSETSLGEIDPASETMKLATLGMRGVATTILWSQANEAKMKENWEGFAASLNQISKLQPHFISVWVFQAWNMSYNVSVEFDDYRYRYHWVKKGVDYLMEGIRFNQRQPKLYWHLGWSFGQKIGRSDERVQFRELFHDDTDYHATLPIDFDDPNVKVRDYKLRVDNWLVGREFLLRGQRLADRYNIEELGQSKVVFHSEPAMFRMNYAETIEEEGFFGKEAGRSWKLASEEWHEFGDRVLTYSQDDIRFRLNDLEALREEADMLRQKFDDLFADIRREIRDEKMNDLTDEERNAYELPAEARSEEESHLAAHAERKLEVSHDEVADRAPADLKQEAELLAEQLADLERREGIVASYRGIVNFEFWRTRAESEQLPTMLAARRALFDANRLYDDAQLLQAKEKYEEAWDNFAEIYGQFPSLVEKDPDTEDLVEDIGRYRELLGQLEEELPQNFKLQMVLDLYDKQRGRSQSQVKDSSTAEATATTATDDNEATTDVPEVGTPEESSPTDNPRDAAPMPPIPVEDASSENEAPVPASEPPMIDDTNPREAPPKPPVPATADG